MPLRMAPASAGPFCRHGLTAELPLGVCRNGSAFLEVSRLLIADAPGRNHAVFEVTMLQRHCFLLLGVIGCVEHAAPLTTV